MHTTNQIVFIHGLHENDHTWSEWKKYFEQLGYVTQSPPYPFHAGVPSILRQKPDHALAKIRLRHLVAHYEQIIERISTTESRPILIGHSMGGLVVQKLIQKKLGSIGVCITSASPQGIFSFKWSFLKSNLGTINPLRGNSLFCGSKKWFHYAINNTLTRKESDEIYQKTVVPESRNIPRSSRMKDGYIDFKAPHAPLLFISAEKDHIIPIELNIKNFHAYSDDKSIRHFKEFKDRSHGLCNQPGWEQVAVYISQWITKPENDFPR